MLTLASCTMVITFPVFTVLCIFIRVFTINKIKGFKPPTWYQSRPNFLRLTSPSPLRPTHHPRRHRRPLGPSCPRRARGRPGCITIPAAPRLNLPRPRENEASSFGLPPSVLPGGNPPPSPLLSLLDSGDLRVRERDSDSLSVRERAAANAWAISAYGGVQILIAGRDPDPLPSGPSPPAPSPDRVHQPQEQGPRLHPPASRFRSAQTHPCLCLHRASDPDIKAIVEICRSSPASSSFPLGHETGQGTSRCCRPSRSRRRAPRSLAPVGHPRPPPLPSSASAAHAPLAVTGSGCEGHRRRLLDVRPRGKGKIPSPLGKSYSTTEGILL